MINVLDRVGRRARALAVATAAIVAHAGSPAAQDDGKADASQAPDLATLIERVHRAHWGERTELELDRFAATLRITETARDRDNIEVRIGAQFLMPRFIRYRIEDAESTLERGQDEKGPWARTARGVYKLQGREYASERDEVKRHVRLARQLLGYVDPRRTLRELDVDGAPQAKDLQLGRTRIACWSVDGAVDDFPIYQDAELEGVARVRLRVWIERATSRLAAVEAHPVDARGKPLAPTELILLHKHQDRGGVLLPTRLLFYRRSGGVEARPQLRLDVRIEGIDLEPAIDASDLARPPS